MTRCIRLRSQTVGRHRRSIEPGDSGIRCRTRWSRRTDELQRKGRASRLASGGAATLAGSGHVRRHHAFAVPLRGHGRLLNDAPYHRHDRLGDGLVSATRKVAAVVAAALARGDVVPQYCVNAL